MPRPFYHAVTLVLLAAWITTPVAAEDASLRGTFLVAAPQLAGSPFERSVILVIEHGESGAQGLIVNRPTDATLADALPEEMADDGRDYRLHMGGPVRLQWLTLLVRTGDSEPGLERVLPDVGYAAAESTFNTILAASPEPDDIRAFAGYAGWAPGQLEHEIERGDWYILPARAGQIFAEKPETLWRELHDQVQGSAGDEPLQST